MWLSNKIKWLTFLATWAVVGIHSRTDRWSDGESINSAYCIGSAISELLVFAVPLFFIVSGYFFVMSFEKYGYVGLVSKKVKSLYLPVVLWSVIGVVVCLPIRMYTGNDIPTCSQVLSLPLLIFRSEAMHFWYVRALLVFFVCAPIVAFIAKSGVLTALMILGAFSIPAESIASQQRLPVSIIFLFLGARIAVLKPRFLTRQVCNLGGIVWCAALWLFFRSTMNSYYFSIFVGPLLMISFLWLVYDYVDFRCEIPKFPNSLNVMFFVYCAHLIVVCLVGGVIRVCFGSSLLVRLCAYFILFQTFWLDILLANLVKRIAPRLYNIASGGRV